MKQKMIKPLLRQRNNEPAPERKSGKIPRTILGGVIGFILFILITLLFQSRNYPLNTVALILQSPGYATIIIIYLFNDGPLFVELSHSSEIILEYVTLYIIP
ncbi:MAG TPA: hypothetical protein DIW23_08345, partial [Anaerolineae bacterium]|nr:hypothetical protein [Anaerolineae bacterium]